MTRYYISIDTIVSVDGGTEKVRYEQAREKFLKLLLDLNSGIEFVCIDQDDEYDDLEELPTVDPIDLD
jgi:hypothetical protein